MSRWLGRGGIAGVAVVGLVLAGSSAGAAGASGGALRGPIKMSYVTGSQVSADQSARCDGSLATGDGDVALAVEMRFAWRGGAGEYSLLPWRSSGEDYENRLPPLAAGVREWAAWGDNTNHACGGSSNGIQRYDVFASGGGVDGAAEEMVSVWGGTLTATQESGNADQSYRAVKPTLVYAGAGAWGVGRCACWSNGAVARTSVAGASVEMKVDLAGWGGWAGGGPKTVTHLGIVMHKGPGRGVARVLVDGVAVGVVDTGAAVDMPRVVVWQGVLDATKVHVVKLVNVGTPGRGRIDFDAVLTN